MWNYLSIRMGYYINPDLKKYPSVWKMVFSFYYTKRKSFTHLECVEILLCFGSGLKALFVIVEYILLIKNVEWYFFLKQGHGMEPYGGLILQLIGLG